MHTTKKFKDLTQKKRQLSHFLNFYVFLTVELPPGKNDPGGRSTAAVAATSEKRTDFQKELTAKRSFGNILLFSTVIEEKNERKAFEIGPKAHFYLDENVVWDLHFIIFFDICSMFLVNSISCPVEDGTAAPGNPVHPILYNRPDNRCPGNSPHSCSSMSPISDLV